MSRTILQAIGAVLLLLLPFSAPIARGADWPQWRGPDRENKSSETRLLHEWPEGGPPLAWHVTGLGEGIASVSIAGGRIYTTTYKHRQDFIVSLDQSSGELAWATPVGPAVSENTLMRWLSQRTPTLDGDRLYAVTARGVLVCLSTADGSELWRRSYVDDFHGQKGWWGFCDFPLVDGERLICTPGGTRDTIVALDRETGEVIWKTPIQFADGRDSNAAYAAMRVTEVGGIRQYVNYLTGGLVGVAADDGRLLWTYERLRGDQSALTPLVRGDQIFCAGGHASYGTALLTLVAGDDDQGWSVREEYFNRTALNHFQDNLVRLDDYVFATGRREGLLCIDARDGEIVWQADLPSDRRRARAFRALTYADGHLYLRDSYGTVELIEASADAHRVKSSFALPEPARGTGATAPVVAGGHLYLRDDDRLFAFDVRRDTPARPTAEPRNVAIDLETSVTRRDGEQAADSDPRSVFVATPQDVVERMLELAEVGKDDVVVDLGSGDGRILITAAKKYGSRAVGYEIERQLVELSRANAEKAGVGDLVTIQHQDLSSADLSEVNVVVAFLVPEQLQKLIGQLEKLPAGARVVSHQFDIPGIPPTRTLRMRSDDDGAEHAIHLWVAPLK